MENKFRFLLESWLVRDPLMGPDLLFVQHRILSTAVVLKLFHVEDPHIDTYQLADPQLKTYDWDAHIRDDYYSSDFQPFSF